MHVTHEMGEPEELNMHANEASPCGFKRIPNACDSICSLNPDTNALCWRVYAVAMVSHIA